MNSSSIVIRSYRDESDLQPIVDLIDACERVDKLETFVSIEQLRLSITNPAIDRDRDLSLWENAQGKVIGFSQLSIAEPIADNLAEGTLGMIVHPAARNGDLDSQIIA